MKSIKSSIIFSFKILRLKTKKTAKPLPFRKNKKDKLMEKSFEYIFIAVQIQLECTERINWQDNYELSVFMVGTQPNA